MDIKKVAQLLAENPYTHKSPRLKVILYSMSNPKFDESELVNFMVTTSQENEALINRCVELTNKITERSHFVNQLDVRVPKLTLRQRIKLKLIDWV